MKSTSESTSRLTLSRFCLVTSKVVGRGVCCLHMKLVSICVCFFPSNLIIELHWPNLLLFSNKQVMTVYCVQWESIYWSVRLLWWHLPYVTQSPCCNLVFMSHMCFTPSHLLARTTFLFTWTQDIALKWVRHDLHFTNQLIRNYQA